MTNPVMNEIESLTGGSLATTVTAPKNQQPLVGGERGLEAPEMSQDFGVQPGTQVIPNVQEQPVEQDSVVVSGVQQPTESLEEVMDPVSYNRRRFQKVQPYTVTMPNGDRFETTSLDKDKILYDYYKSLRSDPRVLGMRESTIDRANKSYFGYTEVPEGITESFFGAFGRAFVNLYTNMPIDLFNTSAIATFSTISNNPYLTDEQKQEAKSVLQKEIEAGIKVKNDLTAHPSAYWVDVKETGWSKVGAGLGSVVASVVPAFLTGGASIGVNMTERAAVKTATKAASKRLGKEAGKDAAETMGKRATNIKNLSREFKRNPQFDPSMAKKSLALTYTNKIANGLNYAMAAGEAADAAVEVYLDALNKTNDFDYAANRALQAGSIVGVLGASPEWLHGAYGALTGASRRMWKAAVAGDKAALRRMVAGDIAGSFALEGTSEVAQDVTTLGYMNKPVDPKEEFMTFMLAGIMAGSMTGVSNRRTPSRAIENATEFKQQLKDVLKTRADIFNRIMGSESAYIIRDEDIDKLMDIVDDPNFDTLAEKIVKKGILENVDKMEDMEDADKNALKERLESENYDASVQAFMDFDKTIDDVVLANDTELTPAQRVIFKSIMHGVAQFAIISGRISNPNELLGGLNGLITGGTESYVENGNAYIATAEGINRAPYQAGEVEVNPRGNEAQQLSARINNQIENSATKGMSQGAVDILHEVLGHLFASDVVADGDLPHFMIRYTELLEEAIKEVMPNAVIDENTPVEALDEYRAYAMANSTKIAEMLGFTGDTAKLFKFFEQMTLANRANFGAIKEYVDTLRTMLVENSEAIRGLIDAYGEDLSDAIKHYADTGDAGVLTNDDLKALSHIFKTGLADSDAKLDLMSAIGDSNTYQKLTDRLGTRFNEAVKQDKADVARVLKDSIKQAQDEIKNSEHAPVNEEAVEVLDELSKKQVDEDADFLNNMPGEEESEEKQTKKNKTKAKTMVNNQVTFDGKKYYYLTKKPLVMPNPEAVKAVQHTKEEGEPESVDNETYRASQLATTGLTQSELDAFTNWSLNQIKLNAPAGVFDELMKQINQVIDSDVELIPLPNNDDYGRRAGYEFKFVGELQLGNSKMIFDENTVFSNANQRTSALSSDIAYYVMAKRAAKADNKRYSVHAINSTIGKYLENNPEKRDVLDDVAARLADYESQYQYSGFVASNDEINTSEYISLLRDLRDTLTDNNIDIRVDELVYRGRIDDEKLKDLGDWYNNFYTRLEKENDITKLKGIVKDKLALAKNETSELDALPTKDAVLEFVHQYANNFKYLPKTKKAKKTKDNEPQSFLDIIDEEMVNTVQDENAKTRDVSAWYDPAKKVKLTAEQKKFLKLGKKIAMSEEDRDKLISAYLKTRPELHTNKDDSPLDVFTSVNITESGDVLTLDEGEQVPYTMAPQEEQDEQVEQVEASKPVNKKYQSIAEKIDSLFGESGVKEYTPITNYEAQIGYAALSSTVNSDEGVNLMPVKYTTPEEYGFKSARQMQAVFRAYEVPSMTFDIDKYLYNPRTGKVNKKGVIDYSDFLYDFAEMAKAQLAARGLDNGDGLSFANKLAYVKAVIDANNAARQAYSEYSKEVAKRANEHGLRSSTENQLLNDEGYEKFASVEEVKNNDNDLMKSMLFKELGKRPLFSFFGGDGKMYPTFNTKYLELGRVVRFPYGQNPRMGVIVGAFPVVPGMYSETHDMLYLFRTVANLKNGIKYEEFYVPRSDFVEMTRDNGKQFMVSDGTFDEIGLAWFNKYFDEKLANQNNGKTTKFDEFVRIVDATTPADVKENPEQYYARTGGSNNRRYAVRKTITPEMADLIKSFTPDDSEYDADIDPETLKFMKARDVSRNLASFAFNGTAPGQQMSQADYRQALEAYDLSKNMSRKPVATFASEPFMGTMNVIDYMNDLTNKVNESTSKANKTKLSGLVNKVPLFLGSQSGTGRVWRMMIGEDPSVRSLEESAQRMTEASETATQQLQAEIATTLKNKGGAQSFNDYFRNRLKNSPIKARLFNANGEEVDITMGEIQNLYAAKLIEETVVNGKYKYEQKIIDGGNNIYSRLKKTYVNANELVEQLSETDKLVVEAMLDFFTKYVKTQQKRFALSLGSYAKSVEKGWAARNQYFTRATKAEMTDQNSLLVVDDLFDTLNADFKANAIYNSGVKKDLTAMKNMLTFGLKYMNAEEGMSGYERFLEDFKLNGDLDENSEDFKMFQNMLAASNALRQAIKQALGNFGFERFMKRLDFESTQPEKAFNLLPSGIGKLFDQFTRTSMASKLAFKPKNALQNFVGAWQRCCPLSDSTLRWYTTDLLDAIINYKDAIESAKDNAFIWHRLERNALGAEYQKVTDASSAESLLAELSIKASNLKKKGSVTASQVFALLDDFAKKMTKISVSYGTSGADFLGLAFAWYKLKPGLQKQALAIQKANAGSGKGLVTAETLFMNHVLRNISSSNFMTRSPLQNWAIRNHMGALTAFLNDSLQSYGAIGEAWYGLHNAKTNEEKRYLRRVITSNIASQLFYIATQIGAFSALYGWVATDDGLTEAEQEYLWDSMLREFVGQLSSITAFDVVTRPLLETALLKEKRQSGNILVSALQDIFADAHDFDAPKLLADTLDMLGGFAGTNRAIDVADALWSAYNQDDESYRAVGEVLYGRTKKTALKIQGLRENSKGEVVNKK